MELKKKGASPHNQANSHTRLWYKYNILFKINRVMVKDFSTISELKTIREQKSRLSERESELSTPLLADLGLIPEIFKWFAEILAGMDFPPCLESVTQRKKFLFIILFLYSPSTLAGGKMLCGLRDKLCEVTNIASKSTISDNCADVVFMYQNYKNFRKDTDYLYTEILNRLQVKGLIN